MERETPLLGEALRLLARAYIAPGSLDPAWARDMSGALATLGTPAEVPDPASGLEEEAGALFDRGPCPPYETLYTTRGASQTAEMADVAGFYRAFGLQAVGERPDHIGAELEFYAHLCALEARALARSEEEHAGICRAARAKFLQDHLGRWLPLFASRLEEAGNAFYSRLTRIADRLVASEASALGIRREIPTGAPPPILEEGCEGCPALPRPLT